MAKLPRCHLHISLAATLALLSLAHVAVASSNHRHHRHSSQPSDQDTDQDTDQFSDQFSDQFNDQLNDHLTDRQQQQPPEQDTGSSDGSFTQITGQCDFCQTREAQKEARTEFLKQKILKQLGLQAPPNVTFNRKVPAIPALSEILDEFEMQGMAPYHHYRDDRYNYDDVDEEEEEHKSTVMKLLIPLPPPDFVPRRNNETDIYFQFRPEVLASHVSLAKLHVYIRGSTSGESGTSVLLVQAIMANGQVNVIRKKRIAVGGYRVGEWVVVNIRSQVRQWLTRPGTNLGLRIEAFDLSGSNVAIIRPMNQDEEAYIPVLELKDFPPSRVRRDKPNRMICRENSTETNCCLFPLRVDFSKFGWDWIIAPRKYNANYCAGKCGFLFKTTHRVSHIVQQSMPGNAGPCCAPRKLNPLRLVYFSQEQQIIWGRLAGMITEECGCA